MENEFVGYEAAKRIKALGFDEPCIAVYGYNMQEGYPKEARERLVWINEISFTEGYLTEARDLRNSVLGEDISAPAYCQALTVTFIINIDMIIYSVKKPNLMSLLHIS